MFNQAQLLHQQNQQKQDMLLAACMLLQQQSNVPAPGLNNAWIQARTLAGTGSNSSANSYAVGAVSEDSSSDANSIGKGSEASDQLSDDEFFSQESNAAEGAHTDRDTKNETFPMKLYRMLFEAEKNGEDGIVAWSASGRAFHIHKPDQFIADVMPKYFTTTRLASFQRQLNLYGFRRLTHGADKGGYTHCQQYFFKGKRHLCSKVKRKSQGLATKPPTGPAAMTGFNPMYGATAMNAPMMGAMGMGMFGPADMSSLLGTAAAAPPSAMSSLAMANYNTRLGMLAQASQAAASQPPLSSLMGLVRQGLLDRSTVDEGSLSASAAAAATASKEATATDSSDSSETVKRDEKASTKD